MTAQTPDRTLDTREIDGPPFADIMAELDELEGGQRLELLVAFEPVPLYDVLESRGFDHRAERREDGVWRVLIDHGG